MAMRTTPAYDARVVRFGSASLATLCGMTLLAGCGAFVPDPPDANAVATVPPDVPAALDVPSGLSCERDEDCAPFAGCCFDLVCSAGQCEPRLIDACCSELGPCATTGPFEAGDCQARCTAGGCRPHLLLPSSDCGETHWEAAFDAVGIGTWSFEDTASDAVTWHLSTRRTFGGHATLRAGNVLCANYHAGPQGPSCAADPGPDGPVHLVARTPPVTLPAGAPSVLLVWVWVDVGTASETAVDGLAIDVTGASNMGIAAWSSRASAVPARAWTPIALDVSALAAQAIQVSLTFDAPDGRPHAHEGVYIGAVRTWTPCASERVCPPAGPCAVGRMTALAPLDDAICSVAWPDPGVSCVLCNDASSCPVGSCERASCVAGACVREADAVADCCDPAPSWADGDPGFEGPSAPADGSSRASAPRSSRANWESDGAGWSRSALRARSGNAALHFGLADGSALAPAGEAGAGSVWTPIVVVPSEAPRWVFWLWLSTEWDLAPSGDNPTGVDRLEALVRIDAAPGPTRVEATVWDSDAIGGTSGGQWARVEVALDAWAGLPVRLGWRFATGDAENNAFEGAFIDDASVFRACPGCTGGQVDDPGCGGP